MAFNFLPELLRRFRNDKPTDPNLPEFGHIDREGNVGNVHYYEVGAEDSPCTVVFIHGFTLSSAAFFYQVAGLRDIAGTRSLLVDLRGHGNTGEVPIESCTIDGAADDVAAVIAERCPKGPLILVGHSLGGITAMNLLRRFPTIAERTAGLLLLASSIEPFSTEGLPQVLLSPVANKLHTLAQSAPGITEQMRRDTADALAPMLATLFFHNKGTDYDLVEFHAQLIQKTPLATLFGFFDDLQAHDEIAAAEILHTIPGIIMVGAQDRVTPVHQAEKIQQLWPQAELRIVENTGHMLILETPEDINDALVELVRTIVATD